MANQAVNDRMGRRLAVLTVAVFSWSIAVCGALYGGTVKSAPDTVVYNGTYPGWPWIDKTPSGKLLCVWREGTAHGYSASGRVMLSTSVTSGTSWSAASTIVDAALIDDRNAAIAAFSDTDWLICYNTYTSGGVSRAMTTRTTNGGVTWTPPQAISPLDARTRAAPIKLSTGNLILPYYENSPSPKSLAALSDNNGQTWTTVEVPNGPGFLGDEWSIVEMPDHSLAGIVRNTGDGSGYLYMTKSTDWGQSWSTPVQTNLRDTRLTSPAQIFLHDGKPWVLYDDARMVSVAMATTNDPNLITWDIDQKVTPYQYRADGQPISDGGYPCSVALSGGQRLIVDYVIDGGTRAINGYVVSLPVAEPSSFALLWIGAATVFFGVFLRRRRRLRQLSLN